MSYHLDLHRITFIMSSSKSESDHNTERLYHENGSFRNVCYFELEGISTEKNPAYPIDITERYVMLKPAIHRRYCRPLEDDFS